MSNERSPSFGYSSIGMISAKTPKLDPLLILLLCRAKSQNILLLVSVRKLILFAINGVDASNLRLVKILQVLNFNYVDYPQIRSNFGQSPLLLALGELREPFATPRTVCKLVLPKFPVVFYTHTQGISEGQRIELTLLTTINNIVKNDPSVRFQ